jgi:hypothetical protein
MIALKAVEISNSCGTLVVASVAIENDTMPLMPVGSLLLTAFKICFNISLG